MGWYPKNRDEDHQSVKLQSPPDMITNFGRSLTYSYLKFSDGLDTETR